jgi:hypothetical protein
MSSRASITPAVIIIVGTLVLLAGIVVVGRFTFLAPVFWPTPTPTPTNTPTPTHTPTPTPTHTPTPTPTDTPTPTPTDTPTPVPTFTPVPTRDASSPSSTPKWSAVEATPRADCSVPAPAQSTIRGRRYIAYYGTCLGPGLGILGRHGMVETLSLLQEQAEAYRALDPCVETVPVFHMVTTIADASPGEDGDYNHRVPHETIQAWVDYAAAAGGISVLDIQPARGDVMTELALVEPLLLRPGVHLAIDPEFMVGDDGLPGTNLGHITGEVINQIQAWLNMVAERAGENKVLVFHQFNDRMARNKEVIQDYPLVDLVWDADGFGGPGAKVDDYHQYRDEAGFEYGGFKIFYRYDSLVMTPGQVMNMTPPPAYVIYQ